MKKGKNGPFVKAKTRPASHDHAARVWAIERGIVGQRASFEEEEDDGFDPRLTRRLLLAAKG